MTSCVPLNPLRNSLSKLGPVDHHAGIDSGGSTNAVPLTERAGGMTGAGPLTAGGRGGLGASRWIDRCRAVPDSLRIGAAG